MDEIHADFAGAERTFRLRFGDLVDIETACGKVGIATIFQRLARTEFYANDVKQVLLRGLVGGGMQAREAEALVVAQFDARPFMYFAALAQDVILAAMTGIEADDSDRTSTDKPIQWGQALHAMAQLGLAPEQVRETRYADFIALLRAAGGEKVAAPTEEEFDDMISRWKARQK